MPPPTEAIPRRIQIQDVRRRSTAAAIRSSVTVGDRVDVAATIFSDGHDVLARGRPLPAGGRARLARGAARAGRQRPLARRASRSGRLGRWQFGVQAWVDPYATLARRARPQGRRGAGGADRRARRRARRSSARATVEEWRAAAPALGVKERPGSRRRSRSRSTSSASGRASAPGTSSSRAPGAASRGVDEGAAAARRARLRRRLPAADPPDRPHEPQGAEQRAVAAKGDPGSPWAIGARRGRARRDPPGARHAGGLRAARRARRASTGSRSRSTSRSSARPTTRGSTRAPGVVPTAGPDGTLKYAENPPKRYQDIYNVNFDSPRTGEALWEALRDVVLALVPPRRARLPRRQPAHEVGAVLGVADRRGARASTRTRSSSPRRSRGRR